MLNTPVAAWHHKSFLIEILIIYRIMKIKNRFDVVLIAIANKVDVLFQRLDSDFHAWESWTLWDKKIKYCSSIDHNSYESDHILAFFSFSTATKNVFLLFFNYPPKSNCRACLDLLRILWGFLIEAELVKLFVYLCVCSALLFAEAKFYVAISFFPLDNTPGFLVITAFDTSFCK